MGDWNKRDEPRGRSTVAIVPHRFAEKYVIWLLLPQALSSRLRCKASARVGHGSGGAAAAETDQGVGSRFAQITRRGRYVFEDRPFFAITSGSSLPAGRRDRRCRAAEGTNVTLPKRTQVANVAKDLPGRVL
jgi:hypothetical protein